jgi:hypothetical protein
MSINSHEPNVPTMDKETNPITIAGEVSLPASTADELERIRYVLTQIKKLINAGVAPAHWYIPVNATSTGMSFPAVACRREMATAQPIPHNVSTRILFDTTVYDTGFIASGRGLLINLDGVYAVGATLGFGDGATMGPTGDFTLTISVANISTGIQVVTPLATQECFTFSTAAPKALTVETTAHFTKGEYVQAYVTQTDGSTKLPTTQTDARPAIWMAMVSA